MPSLIKMANNWYNVLTPSYQFHRKRLSIKCMRYVNTIISTYVYKKYIFLLDLTLYYFIMIDDESQEITDIEVKEILSGF